MAKSEKKKQYNKIYKRIHSERINIARRLDYSKNKEKYRARSRKYKQENPEKAKKSRIKYVTENPEKVKISTQKYRDKNREKVRLWARNFYYKNREKRLALSKKLGKLWRDSHPVERRLRQIKYRTNNREKYIASMQKQSKKESEKLRIKEWSKKNPEKVTAHRLANSALKNGFIQIKNACEACGAESKLEMHHEDYSKPLKVKFLCKSCHRIVNWAGRMSK